MEHDSLSSSSTVLPFQSEEYSRFRPHESSAKQLCDSIGRVTTIQLISGAIAGGVSRSVTAPLDRLKVLLQVRRSSERILARDVFKGLVVQEGCLGLFRGNGANCLKVIPETSLKFFFYDLLKRRIIYSFHVLQLKNIQTEHQICVETSLETEHAFPLSLGEKFMAGSLAGVISQSIIYPLDVIKTRLTVSQPGTYRSISHCIIQIFRHEKLFGFYRGYTASVLGMIPYAGLDLACYETLKRHFSSVFIPNKEASLPFYGAMCFGTLSSTLGQVVSYPLALMRTRLQADGMCGTPPQFRGLRHAFRSTVHQEGSKALYRGIGPHLLKSVPSISISWTIYEASKQFLNNTFP